LVKNIEMKKNLFLLFCLVCVTFESVVLAQDVNEINVDVYYLKKFKNDKERIKIITKDYNSLNNSEKSLFENKSKFVKYDDMISYVNKLKETHKEEVNTIKKSLDKTNSELKELKLNEVDQILSSLPFSNIGNLGFATKALGEDLIKKLIPEIQKVNPVKFKEKTDSLIPAFCYNSLDPYGDFGILLNSPAIVKLLEKLDQSEYWNLPTKEEMDNINVNLSKKKIAAFEALASSESNKYFKWTKLGKDYYDMKLLPWGYRLDEEEFPLANQKKSCNFAALDFKNKIDFKNELGIIKLEDNGNLLEFMTRDNSDGAYGLYVLLFRNKNNNKNR
jgi:hypothetical protein